MGGANIRLTGRASITPRFILGSQNGGGFDFILGPNKAKLAELYSQLGELENTEKPGSETYEHIKRQIELMSESANLNMLSVSWQKDDDTEQPGDWTEGSSVNLKLRHSPSDIFFLSSDYLYNKSEEGSDSTYGFNISWLPGEKIQLNFSSKFKENKTAQNNDKTISCSLDASWNISRQLIFKSGYSYSKSKGKRNDENQTLYTRLSARF